MPESSGIIVWLKTIGVRIMMWVPVLGFKRWVYPDSVFIEHLELRPSYEGVSVYKGEPGRIQVPLDIINLSPYCDVFIDTLKASVGSFADLSSQSEVIPKLKVRRVTLDGIASSEQQQSIKKAGMVTLNCDVKFSWRRAEALLRKGFTFQNVEVNRNCRN